MKEFSLEINGRHGPITLAEYEHNDTYPFVLYATEWDESALTLDEAKSLRAWLDYWIKVHEQS